MSRTLCVATLLVVASLPAVGAVVPPVAGQLAALETGKITDTMLEAMQNAQPGDLLPAIIVMRDQALDQELEQFRAIRDRHARREAVKALLKGVAARSQGGVLEALRAGQNAGTVGPNVVSLWLSNLIGAEVTRDMVRQLAQRDDVAYVSLDVVLGPEVFPVEPGEGGPSTAIECGVNLMGAPRVWSELNITGRGAVVGIIDTGCCITHPDLRNQIWVNPGEIPANGVDDDGNGFVDDINGWSFDGNGSNSNISDTNGHGTHTTGTVAGDGTNGQQTGMAPDVAMMILKFWNSFSGELSVWRGMQYIVDNGGDVITASLGWPHSTNPNRPVWRQNSENAMAAGVVVIFAAGNEGCSRPPDNVRTPGDVPDMITVGATDCNDNIASFSSCGPVTWQNIPPYNDWPYPPGKMKPTISAPGVNTLSTSNNCTGYFSLSGTSMATPHVAGAVALMLEACPTLDHFDVKDILQVTSRDLGQQGRDNTYGAGRVDAYAAVREALARCCDPCDMNCDGVVNSSDIQPFIDILFNGARPCAPCTGDTDGDGDRDAADIQGFIDCLY